VSLQKGTSGPPNQFPDLPNNHTDSPSQCAFQIHEEGFFAQADLVQYLEHIYAEKVFITYLKIKLNWASSFYLATVLQIKLWD
jgi:hypothetical protein